MKRLTKAQRKAMEWVAANEPVGTFPLDGIAPDMRFVTKRLVRLGYVERVGTEAQRGFFAFSTFALTDAGREALKASP
jgi:hypothetical protein